MAVIMKDKVSVRGPAYFIQGDTQTQIVCFSVARYRDGVDLAQLTWSVHIKNAAGQEDVAVPHEQPDVRTDKININWLVQGVATAAAGYMTFCLRGVGTDPEGEPLRWSSGDEVREVHAAQESEASGEQADKLSELDALIEYVAKELPAVVQAGTEAKRAAADAEAAALATNKAIDRANRLADLPDIGDPGAQGKVLAVGRGEGDDPKWILSSQINDTVVSAESTWSSKNTVERFLPEFSESGAAVECHPFPLCPLDVSTTFEPAQVGSGDPYPAGGGKNLLLNTAGSGTANGITFTLNADGTVTANGTATANAYYDINKALSLPAGQYALSGCPSSSNGANYLVYAQSAKGDRYDSGKGVYFDAAADETWYVRIKIASGITVSNLTFRPMIRKATETDATYAPYSNIRPISGYDSLELTQADKTENKNTYTVQLGQIVYGGTYDWNKGELVAEWKLVTFDGTENATLNSAESDYYNRFNYYGLKDTNMASSLPELSVFSHFRTRRFHDQGSLLRNTAEMHSNEFYPIFRVDKAWSTVEEWTSYIAEQYAAGTPVQICYKLATPITIQLAPLEIMPLDGTNVLSSNPGNTTVSGKLDPIYLHEQNKAAAAKLAGMETRLRALESAAVNNA